MWPDAVQSWFRARSRPERLAFLAWAILLTVLCARTLCNGRSHSVYPIFADAGANWYAGAELYGPHRSADHDQFRYSPLVAAFFVPFTYLSPGVGGVLWRLLNAGVYLTTLAWCSRTILPQRPTRAWRALLFLLVIPLSVGSLNNGQSNALVTGLLLATVAGVAVERWNLASACLAVACLLKVYPVALGLLLAALYPRRFGGRFVLMLGIGLALPFVLQRSDYVLAQYVSWIQALHGDDRTSVWLAISYRDLGLLCRLAHVPVSRTGYLLLQLAGGTSVLLLCLLGRRAGWSRRQLLSAALALSTGWMTLLGPATESCTYILLAPAQAWAVLYSSLAPAPRYVRSLVFGSYGLFTFAALVCWFPEGARWHALGVQPLAALLLVAGLVSVYWTEMRNRALRLRPAEGAETWPAISPDSV